MPNASPIENLEVKFPRIQDPYSTIFPSLLDVSKDVKKADAPIKVCIATEDIVGPIRNGGIGTTYTHLALLLAEAGHDTYIYYLRGTHAEGEHIGFWINWYKERGVKFVPVEMNLKMNSPANRWIQPSLRLYQELKKEQFDVVHISEWRGSAYFSLVAKKYGLAFRNTLFCIKTSSPWLWNRETCLRTIDESADLVKMYMERCSVELADIVIGGSAYLLRWMMDHGYRMPKNRTFVQPNVVQPVSLPENLTQNRPDYGSRVPVKEIVFFGRLEHRKGLEIFCEAINELISNGVEIPSITFMGKYGARIPSFPNLSVEEFIESKASKWNIQWKILNDKNQHEALAYLHGDGVLAVMPSLAENSTLAVYEATHFAIPFIATDVGGTSELVRDDHVSEVLTEAEPLSLAEKIVFAVKEGGFVAAPEFSNDNNLQEWRDFHAKAPEIVKAQKWNDPENFQNPLIKSDSDVITTVCLIFKDDERQLQRTLDNLTESSNTRFEILIINDGSKDSKSLAWLEELEKSIENNRHSISVISIPHQGQEKAKNFAASKAQGKYLLFIDSEAHPSKDAIDSLHTITLNSAPEIVLPFYTETTDSQFGKEKANNPQVAFIAGDPAFTFSEPNWRSPLIFVRKDIFEGLGGFTCDYKIPGAAEEFVAQAILNNVTVDSIPESLAEKVSDYPLVEDVDKDAFHTRAIRPFLTDAPLKYQSIILNAKAKELKAKSLKSLARTTQNNKNTDRIIKKQELKIEKLLSDKAKLLADKDKLKERLELALEKSKAEKLQLTELVTKIRDKHTEDKTKLKAQLENNRNKHQEDKAKLTEKLVAAKQEARTFNEETEKLNRKIEEVEQKHLEEKLQYENESALRSESLIIDDFLNADSTAESLESLIDTDTDENIAAYQEEYIEVENEEDPVEYVANKANTVKNKPTYDDLRAKLTNPEQIYLVDLLESKSWLVTKPLRVIVRVFFRAGNALTIEDVVYTDNPSDLRLKVESSWSWRISRPLRQADSLIKRMGKSNK